MGDFAYFRERQHTYRPSTPAAALRAIHCGLAEKEELIHQGINVKPLIEEPFDIKELQRIQSREDLDLDTNLLLHRIFSRMLHDPGGRGLNADHLANLFIDLQHLVDRGAAPVARVPAVGAARALAQHRSLQHLGG